MHGPGRYRLGNGRRTRPVRDHMLPRGPINLLPSRVPVRLQYPCRWAPWQIPATSGQLSEPRGICELRGRRHGEESKWIWQLGRGLGFTAQVHRAKRRGGDWFFNCSTAGVRRCGVCSAERQSQYCLPRGWRPGIARHAPLFEGAGRAGGGGLRLQ